MKFSFTILLICWAFSAFSAQPVLRVKNHKFKIVQFTDLHLIHGPKFTAQNDSTYELMRYIIKNEHPDLVVITGDIVVSGRAAEVWAQLVRPMNEAAVPFAVTFGNHDTETGLSKPALLKLIQKNRYNLTFNANNKLAGTGNCSLPILDSEGKNRSFALYLFDSQAYTNDSTLGYYDWIKNNQVQWYRKQSELYAKQEGKKIPALAFFHIPLPEFEVVRLQKTTVGNVTEPVSSATINSGLFSSFYEMGDIRGVFVGHDHNSDFIGSLNGIRLGFGRKTGYASAYHEILKRGARVIELDEKENKIDTYIRTIAGTEFEYSFTMK